MLLLTAFFTGHNIVNKFKNEDNWAIAQIDNLHHEHNRFYNGFCMLTIGEKRLNYVGKCESVRGWKHRMQTSLIGASCWIFCKALRVFPPEMWTVQIVESITDNILQEEDEHICQKNAIFPKGFNIKYNHAVSNLLKLCTYMHQFEKNQY